METTSVYYKKLVVVVVVVGVAVEERGVVRGAKKNITRQHATAPHFFSEEAKEAWICIETHIYMPRSMVEIKNNGDVNGLTTKQQL